MPSTVTAMAGCQARANSATLSGRAALRRGARAAAHCFGRGRQQQREGHAASRRQHLLRAAAVDDQEDLWQFKDREQWYLPKFAADDQPDWNPARFVSSRDLAPGVREVVLEVEISRERVPLRNAYKHVGQRALVRVNSGVETEAAVAAPPFPLAANREVLLKLRGDLIANATKQASELESVLAELPLLVRQDEAPELYKLSEEDIVELGPFQGAGLDLRGPIASIFSFPTVVIFCEGAGIATAKALLEAGSDVGGLSFDLRPDVRMYYRAPNQAALCYKELFEEWGEKRKCQVITSSRGTFSDMFDDDDTLMYEPATTAAIILTGGDEEAEQAAAEVCKDADIATVVLQSAEQTPTVYLTKGRPSE